jgi:uncharacterized protein DUF3455
MLFHRLLLIAFAASGMACVDSVNPSRSLATGPSFAKLDLGSCTNLAADGELTFRAYASGVQIYRWSGASWVFVAPRATLYGDAGLHGVVGSHYAGPTWESVSGSTVVGAVAERCTPNSSSIPWLLLDAVSSAGPGVFRGVTQIQRVNTVGGIAPSGVGNVIGEIAEVPYTAEYLFYRR